MESISDLASQGAKFLAVVQKLDSDQRLNLAEVLRASIPRRKQDRGSPDAASPAVVRRA